MSALIAPPSPDFSFLPEPQAAALTAAWAEAPQLRVLWAYHVEGVRHARQMEARGYWHSAGSCKLMRKLGINAPCGNPNGKPERNRRIGVLVREGYRVAEIAREMSLPASTVKYIVGNMKRDGKLKNEGPWIEEECRDE